MYTSNNNVDFSVLICVYKKDDAEIFEKALKKKHKLKIEKIILVIGMISFIVHLLIIYLKRYGLISLFEESNFFDNPIACNLI